MPSGSIGKLFRGLWLAVVLAAVGLAGSAWAENPEEVWEEYRGGEFHFPAGVSVNETDGSCWVADTLNNEVALLDENGIELWRRWGFGRPYSVAADPVTGEGWVADTFNNRVVRMNTVLDEVWSQGGFALPVQLEMDKKTRSVWVRDGLAITHLDAQGNQLGRYTPGSSFFPVSLASDSTDDSAWASFCYHCPPPPQACDPAAPVFVHIGSDGKAIHREDKWLADAISVNVATQRVWTSFASLREDDPLAGLVQFTRDMKVDKVIEGSASDLQAHSTIGDGSCWMIQGDSVVLLGRGGEVLWQSTGFWRPSTLSATYARDTCWVADTENCQVVKLQLNPRPFPDVPPRLWAWREIGQCAQAGIVSGFTDGCYHYYLPVTRDQMAAYVARGLAGGEGNVPSGPVVATFPDVSKTYWAYKYIEYAVAQGVVMGKDDGTYGPEEQLNRAQMSAFIARSICTPTGEAGMALYDPPATPAFPDVTNSFWAYKYVEYLAAPERQVVKGYEDGKYHPEYICTRDQMAVYIARAFQLPPWPPSEAKGEEWWGQGEGW